MKKILGKIFPFAITLLLWNLSGPRFNPFGTLSLIPIFYYMFHDRRPYWFWFGAFMCFLIDFNANTLFLFTAAFLTAYALNEMFGALENEGGAGFYPKGFAIFLGLVALFLFFHAVFESRNFFGFILGIIWMCCWLFLLYFPFVRFFRWVGNAR